MSQVEKLIEKRNVVLDEAQAIIAEAKTAERDLTAEEDAKVADLLSQVETLDVAADAQTAVNERMAKAEARREERGLREVAVTVKSEARTYTPQSNNSFIADAYRSTFNNDFNASERLARHMREEQVERRDVTSAAFAGLIVPQFLTELAAPLARAGRPYADRARKHQLPAEGLTLSISKVTTGTAVALQTEGAAVQETNMDDTKLDLSVVTVAGQQDVSRQAIERGTNIDSLVTADLVAAYHGKIDSLFVADLEALTGLNTVTFTSGSPTVKLLYPKIADAVQQIQTTYFAGPNYILMHPRRLAFILAAVDSTDRPLALPTLNNPMNAVAVGSGVMQYGNSGYSIMGLPVITDANIATNLGAGTNEDTIFIGNLQEAHLFEQGSGEPMFFRFEQPKASELEIQMIVYGYATFTHARYEKAFASISGTGLVAPSF